MNQLNVAIHQAIQSNYTITLAKINCTIEVKAKIITYMRGVSVI